jgi:hypothetical protein
MFAIAGGILLAVLTLVLLPWLFVGAAWVIGTLLVAAIGGAAVSAFWAGAQSPTGTSIELLIAAAFGIWLFLNAPPRPPGRPNLAMRIFKGWIRIISAPVLAPMEYWQSMQDRRVQGQGGNVIAVAVGLTWVCFMGVILSWLAISLPALAVFGVLSSFSVK